MEFEPCFICGFVSDVDHDVVLIFAFSLGVIGMDFGTFSNIFLRFLIKGIIPNLCTSLQEITAVSLL